MVKGALQKGAVMTILEEFENDSQALAKEEVYRPSELIGWNIVKGGGKPPTFIATPETRARVSAQFKGKKHSLDHIRKRSESRKGYQHTEITRQTLSDRAKLRDTIYVSCLNCKSTMDYKNYIKSHGGKCGIRQGPAWNTGITMVEQTCPHCGKTGRGGNMTRYHFDNCQKVYEKHVMVKKECPHCGKTGAGGNMSRYHFNNCKTK